MAGWQGRAGKVLPGRGLVREEGNSSRARKGGSAAEHHWPSAISRQTPRGPAASTNLCPLVLDIIPLSDVINSARKISQPK